MNRPSLVISLVAVFLVGIALGLMGGILFASHMHSREPGPWPGRGGGPMAGMRRQGGPPPISEALPRLQRMLNLTPEQVARIKPRVIESQQQFEAARESLRSRIDAELTPEQKKRFDEFHRRHSFPGGPPPPDEDRAHRAPPGDEGEPR